MLKIIHSVKELDFGQLCSVYTQSIGQSGSEYYPWLSPAKQQLQAEQDFYSFLKCFFKEESAFCAVWTVERRAVSALRVEPYGDGLLLEGLETAPEERRKGYAVSLVCSVLSYLKEQNTVQIYSHVDKTNLASLALHKACGFCKILDHAVYVDGSVSHNAYTLYI